MKTKFRGLALATIMLTASHATYTRADDSDYFGSDSSDSPATIGDLPGYAEDAYFAQTAQAAEASAKPARNAVAPAAYQTVARQQVQKTNYNPHSAPVSEGYEYQEASVNCVNYYGAGCGVESCAPMGCDGGCGVSGGCGMGGGCGFEGSCGMASGCGGCGGCGMGGCGHCGSLGMMMSRGCGSWATAEALLWFPQLRDSAPLVSGNTGPGAQTALNAGGVSSFGREIDGGLSAGFRVDGGKWLTDDVGFGGRFWWLQDNDQSGGASSTGDPAIGIPFFNTSNNLLAGIGEAALVVAGTTSGGTTFQGSVNAESSLSLMAAEAYGRFRMSRGRGVGLDLIGGYSHFDIDDSILLQVNNQQTNGANAGNRFSYTDQFNTENQFNGGQVGFESILCRGRWTARSLTKVHLGNMNQTVSIAGASSRTIPGPPDTVLSFGNGIFTNQGNIGVYQRDVFAFAPEMNFKLAYRFRQNISLSVGYTFIYWDNVALAGSQIDRNVDGSTLLNNTAAPGRQAFQIVDRGLWVQGVDLGVVLDF